MEEKRICPVCEREIPRNAQFMCPNCYFGLEFPDDEDAVEKARQRYQKKQRERIASGQNVQPTKFAWRKWVLFGLAGGLIFLGVQWLIAQLDIDRDYAWIAPFSGYLSWILGGSLVKKRFSIHWFWMVLIILLAIFIWLLAYLVNLLFKYPTILFG